MIRSEKMGEDTPHQREHISNAQRIVGGVSQYRPLITRTSLIVAATAETRRDLRISLRVDGRELSIGAAHLGRYGQIQSDYRRARYQIAEEHIGELRAHL